VVQRGVLRKQDPPVGSNLLILAGRKRKAEDVTARSSLSELDDRANPYFEELQALKDTIPEWNHFFQGDGDDSRGNNWVRLDVMGSALVEKYAWCCPDERALKILTQYAPLIEIGAGKGYWAGLLRRRRFCHTNGDGCQIAGQQCSLVDQRFFKKTL